MRDRVHSGGGGILSAPALCVTVCAFALRNAKTRRYGAEFFGLQTAKFHIRFGMRPFNFAVELLCGVNVRANVHNFASQCVLLYAMARGGGR